MKYTYTSIMLLLATLTMSSNSYSHDKFPHLEGPYFGQKTPGLTAEIFAPGTISVNGRYDFGISFSPALDEVYFSVQPTEGPADIHFSTIENNKWQPIKKAKFTQGQKAGEMEPIVRADGNRIYFTGYSADFTHEEIWYVDRVAKGWSKAVKLDSPINDDAVMHLTQAKNGDVFYLNRSKRKIYSSAYKNGEFPQVQAVNLKTGSHPFISANQDYLLVQARNKEDDERKDSEIYVYFKQKDGTWTKPINLGEAVNSSFHERVASVTPDGKYLFFSRYNEEGGIANLYWVSADVIENVRPK